jgi:hypothetical protein
MRDFVAGLEGLAGRAASDPDAEGGEERHAEFLAVIDRTARRLQAYERVAGTAEIATGQQNFQRALRPFLNGSENFRHGLVKPFGHAGDHELLAMLARGTCTSRGLAWHFDRSQLDSSPARACRERLAWVESELTAPAGQNGRVPCAILDLGIGVAPVEQRLLGRFAAAELTIRGVDFEPAALEVAARLLTGVRDLDLRRLNLRDPAVLPEVTALAATSGACLMLGLLEALNDVEAHRLLQAVWAGLPKDGALYADNFLPTHPGRVLLEWFLDLHLIHRSLNELRTLAVHAGIDPARLELHADSTGSLALLKASK